MKKVVILMATYNGVNYLEQQLDSILNQTYNNWSLIVRDDGSTDGTLSILEKYRIKDPRIKVMINKTNSHGAYLNFWTLIHEVRKLDNYDYYFFSDQDDIWEPQKIEIMISEAEKANDSIPTLLYADMRVINQDNENVYDSINEVMGIGEMNGYSLFFTHGFLWGCDICVNQALFCSIPLLPLDHPQISIMSHDNYFGKYALLEGKIVFIDKVLIEHRRHDGNTTGSYNIKLSVFDAMGQCFWKLNEIIKTHAKVYSQSLIMLSLVTSNKAVTAAVIQEIDHAIRRGGIAMVRSMKKLGVKRKQKIRTIGIYCIAITKAYKKYVVF